MTLQAVTDVGQMTVPLMISVLAITIEVMAAAPTSTVMKLNQWMLGQGGQQAVGIHGPHGVQL